MKTSQILLLTVLCVLYLMSCVKEIKPYTEVSGVVYEKGASTPTPIPFTKVRLEWWEIATFGGTRHFVDSTTANADGYYKVAGDLPEYGKFYVLATAPKYFEREGTQIMEPNVTRGRSQSVNLELIPHAWVRKNIKKTGAYAYMNIGPVSGSTKTFSVFSDTTIVTRALGNTEVGITLYKYLNDGQTRSLLRVNTIGHDTVDITIEF